MINNEQVKLNLNFDEWIAHKQLHSCSKGNMKSSHHSQEPERFLNSHKDFLTAHLFYLAHITRRKMWTLPLSVIARVRAEQWVRSAVDWVLQRRKRISSFERWRYARRLIRRRYFCGIFRIFRKQDWSWVTGGRCRCLQLEEIEISRKYVSRGKRVRCRETPQSVRGRNRRFECVLRIIRLLQEIRIDRFVGRQNGLVSGID